MNKHSLVTEVFIASIVIIPIIIAFYIQQRRSLNRFLRNYLDRDVKHCQRLVTSDPLHSEDIIMSLRGRWSGIISNHRINKCIGALFGYDTN